MSTQPQVYQEHQAATRLMSKTESRRFKFIVLTWLLAVVASTISAFTQAGWPAATIIITAEMGLYLVYIYRQRDGWFSRLLLLGTIAGLVELLAERWLVEATGTLVYFPGGPFLLSSPLYFPFAWPLLLLPLGYIARWLSRRHGLLVASMATAILAAIDIPIFDALARGANWYTFQNARMLGVVPLYIIAGDFVMMSILPIVLQAVEKARVVAIVALGILFGLWIWVCYALAIAVLG